MILTCMVAAYLLYYLFGLFASLDEVHFWSDENTHAYISSVIYKTKQLPVLLPEKIYGGYEYSYPPFFHILNAFLLTIGGYEAMQYTNMVLLALFLACFYVLLKRHYGITSANVACLLITLSPIVAINSVRFMTEMLSMVLIFASVFSWLLMLKNDKVSWAIFSGIATGLLMLSKQIGIVIYGFYGLLLIWFFFKQRKYVYPMGYVVGIATAIFLPYFIWALVHKVNIFGFISVLSGNQPGWATTAVVSFQEYSFSPKEFVLLFHEGNGTLFCVSLLVPLFYFLKKRGRDFPHNLVLLLVLYLAGIMMIWHITNSRHTIVLLPMVAFLVGYAFQQLNLKRMVIRSITVLLILFAAFSTYNLPNYRQAYNAPGRMRKMAQYIKDEFPTRKRTLAVQAFDYLMLTGKPVIWLYPNLRDIPIDLFEAQTPFEQYNVLKKYNIDLVLIDTRYVGTNYDFMGRNYPLTFVNNCELLDKLGKLRLKTLSESATLILLEVI